APGSRASPRPSRSEGHGGSGRRLRAVPRGHPATGGRAAAGASWAAATGARLAKAAVRLAFIWPASAGEYGGGQPVSTVRRCRKDHPAARGITAFWHCRWDRAPPGQKAAARDRRLAAGAQPQEDQGEGDGEGDDDRPDPEGLGVAGGEG